MRVADAVFHVDGTVTLGSAAAVALGVGVTEVDGVLAVADGAADGLLAVGDCDVVAEDVGGVVVHPARVAVTSTAAENATM